MEVVFFVRSNGRITGPFTFPALQSLTRRGIVLAEHEISSDRRAWAYAGEYVKLFPPAPARAPASPLTAAKNPPRGKPSHMPPPMAVPPPAAHDEGVDPQFGQSTEAREVTIGRDAGSCDMVVDSLAVSRRHFSLNVSDRGVTAADLGSTGGTYVNGRRLTAPKQLSAGDTVSAGGAQFKFDGRKLVPRPPDLGFAVRIQGLGREVTDRSNGKRRMLIRDIDLTLKPGEFVALVGASGTGKSTLFGAISGRVRATHGRVAFDSQDLYANFEAFRGFIGYVPQRDVFHDTLPVIDALRAAGQLRLSKDTSAAEIDSNIDRVLKIVSLAEKRNTIISNMSGGEQKRVAIALELLSRPRILFLDEPTAPLDPRTTTRMMDLFRRLAEGGITVIMITHAANSLAQCDTVAYLHKGMLTFFGPPEGIKEFFGVTDMGDAYAAEERQTPEAWCAAFKASPTSRAFLAARQVAAARIAPNDTLAASTRRPSPGLAELWHQTKVLSTRYVRVLTIDWRNLAILLALAPAVTAMLCLVTSSIDIKGKDVLPTGYMNYYTQQKMLCFGCVMIVMFLALFASVREIVKELPIYLHEHFINVEIIPYLLSKMLPLQLIGAIQTGLVVAVVNVFGGIEIGDPFIQLGVLFLCSAVGTMLGLMISALVTQSDRAVTGMIIIVIPEILFSGAFLPVKGASKLIAGPLITAYWGMSGLMSQMPKPKFDAMILPLDFRREYPGLAKSCLFMGVHLAVATLLIYLLMVLKDRSRGLERVLTQGKAKPKRRTAKAGAAPPLS